MTLIIGGFSKSCRLTKKGVIKMKKRVLSLFLVFVLTAGLFPTVSAATLDDGLVYEILDNHVEITGYEGVSTEIVIPSEIEGLPVTSIGDMAFANFYSLTSISIPDGVSSIGYAAFINCHSLASISIPDSVSSIGDEAFKYCFNLTSIPIPDRLTYIGHQAFSGCSGLTSFSIPDTVTHIGFYAFSGCSSLTSISIPDSVTTIFDEAFARCSSLTGIHVDANNPNYSSDEQGVLFNKDKTKLMQAPGAIAGAYTIPDSVTSIERASFERCANLTGINIPDSVTSIGLYAFRDCSSLTSIDISARVTTIGDHAFANCSSLTGIHVDADNPNYSSDAQGVLFNKDKTELLQPPCMLAGSYVIPASVTLISERAFSDCSNLTSISIPDGVTSIGIETFAFCSGLTSIVLPDTISFIDSSAFFGCSNLVSVDLPDAITVIADHVFSGCSSLSNIDLPDTLTSIEENAFIQCTSLTSIDFPDTITSIGSGAFFQCTSLTSIDLPETIVTIEELTFSDCSGLTSITLPDTITSIGDHAFLGCSSLTGIDLPDTITSIGNGAFAHCYNLASITLPDTISSIGEAAFSLCDSLKRIHFNGNAPVFGSYAFYKVNATAYYPLGNYTWFRDKMQDYGGTIKWKPHWNIGGRSGDNTIWNLLDGILIISPQQSAQPDITVNSAANADSCRMADYADATETPWYPYHSYIQRVVVEDGIEYIGTNAFGGLEKVNSVYIGSEVNSIGSEAFADCAALEAIVFYGDAPEMDDMVLDGANATISYPADNTTWDDAARESFGEEASFEPYMGAAPAVPEPRSNPFADVPFNTFYYEPVLWAISNNITAGATETTFDPNGKCLRAQVVTFLHRAAGNPEPAVANNPFTDVKTSDFFYKPVLWAVEKSITSGISATAFGSLQNCNRAAVVTFLWRAAGCPEPVSTANPFTDVKTTDYYYKSVLWAVENGITAGLDATHFGPTADCNRAQVVTFLYRAYN